MKYATGEIYTRPTPFIIDDREIVDFDEEGMTTRTIKSWRPGVRNEFVSPDDTEMVWDGMGKEIRRIVGLSEIEGGGFRILYRRTWERPDGGKFGKKTVRMTTPSAFSAWRNGTNSAVARELNRRERRAAIKEQLVKEDQWC